MSSAKAERSIRRDAREQAWCRRLSRRRRSASPWCRHPARGSPQAVPQRAFRSGASPGCSRSTWHWRRVLALMMTCGRCDGPAISRCGRRYPCGGAGHRLRRDMVAEPRPAWQRHPRRAGAGEAVRPNRLVRVRAAAVLAVGGPHPNGGHVQMKAISNPVRRRRGMDNQGCVGRGIADGDGRSGRCAGRRGAGRR